MVMLYGRAWSREELLSRVGDISQVARIKLHRLCEGYEDGVLAADLITGSGFQCTVLGSRGLDISAASFNGRSLAWRSAQMDRHPAYYEPHGLGWLRNFPGGLLTTCGLTYMGAPDRDEGVELGLHGRYSNTPAYAIRAWGDWEGDDYMLRVEGSVREAVVFGENVCLHRTILAHAGESNIRVRDVVRNEGFAPSPHMILYHINLGWPVVDAGSQVVIPATATLPRDAEAADEGDAWMHLHEPRTNYREKVYFHTANAGPDGMATAAVVNPWLDGGLGVYVRYRPDQLPYFVQWKMLGQGTYVVGLEPANALVLGRSKEREAGRLQTLMPGEERCYDLEIGVVSGPEAMALLP